LIMTSHVVAEGFDLPQRGRMPLTLPWGRGQKVGPIDRGVRRSIYVFA
jgi:hypothetical protein